MAIILKGAEVASVIKNTIKAETEALKERGICPALGIIRVGERPDDIYYERSVIKNSRDLGIDVKQYLFEDTVTQEALTDTIRNINTNNKVHGVLMFRPLPKHLDEYAVCQVLLPEKDVDGITDSSMIGVFTGKKQGFSPCTPQACMEILNYYGINCTGKKVVVVGRSLVVGKPAAMLLLGKNATVTICHTKTADLPSVCRDADILIAAAGREKVISKEYADKNQIIVDVGINVNTEGQLCGDVDFDEVEPVVRAITPVPGGVGSVTTAVLLKHVVEAAQISIGMGN